MSKEDDDEARFYRSFRKYEKMVKQMRRFDEIAVIMDAVRSSSTKKKRNSEGQGSCSSTGVADNQENSNRLLVETITKFLNELNEKDNGTDINDPKPSNNP
ncbi:hypothetical protein AB3S75_039427 [Citrus x aurantiifolia]